MARPPFTTSAPFLVFSGQIKWFPRDTANPTKEAPEKVETLIYMRFRGRPHSHKTPRRPSTFPTYTGNWFRCSYFVAALGRPRTRLFLPGVRASTPPMLIDLDFWIISLRWNKKKPEKARIERYASSHPDRGRNTRKADVGTLGICLLSPIYALLFCFWTLRTLHSLVISSLLCSLYLHIN